jgi:hypothetical protein
VIVDDAGLQDNGGHIVVEVFPAAVNYRTSRELNALLPFDADVSVLLLN